jgi:urease accessory protein
MQQGALLRLMWMVSPALPIGGYAYSRGLEFAVSANWVVDASSAESWIVGVLENQLATLDGPVLARLHAAFSVDDALDAARWNTFLCAARETAETALEERQLGLGLARVLAESDVPQAAVWRETGAYVTLFALACVHWGIAQKDALLAYLFAFAEAQVTTASKLVPLGQSAGQRILSALLARLEALAERALSITDAQLGAYTPGLTLASALHETQYARLFRS